MIAKCLTSQRLTQWRNMDRRLKLENLNCLILEFFFSKIYFLDQIYWQALVRPFKWHIGKVCIISRKKVTESGKNVKKGLKFVLFHFFDNENGENIFFGPSQLKVPKRWVLMVLKVFQCLLKQKSYKPNKIFLDLLSTNWAFEPLWTCSVQHSASVNTYNFAYTWNWLQLLTSSAPGPSQASSTQVQHRFQLSESPGA